MRILIADDDFVNRKFLEAVLGEYGEVVSVDDGMSAVEEAVSAIKRNTSFDLICLDIMMTKLDGYKTLESIRDAESKLNVAKENSSKIVMISALDEITLNDFQVSADYNAYVCKPIVLDELITILSKLGFKKSE